MLVMKTLILIKTQMNLTLRMALIHLINQDNSKAKVPLNYADFLLREAILNNNKSKDKRISSKLSIDSVLRINNTSKAKKLRLKMTRTTSSVFGTLQIPMPLLQLSQLKEVKSRQTSERQIYLAIKIWLGLTQQNTSRLKPKKEISNGQTNRLSANNLKHNMTKNCNISMIKKMEETPHLSLSGVGTRKDSSRAPGLLQSMDSFKDL